MPGRYDAETYNPHLDFSKLNKTEAPRRKKDDPLEGALRFLSGIAPVTGTVGGAALGSVVPGIGTAVGAGLGGALGSGFGGAAGMGADALGEGDRRAEEERLGREEERRARLMAADSFMRGFG